MRIVIHYKDDTRKTFDIPDLVFNNSALEFVSDDITYFVFLDDVIAIYVHEDFL